LSSASGLAYMEGTVSSYNSVSGAMDVVLDLKSGTAGAYTDWNLNVAGNPGSLAGVTLGTIASQNANNVTITGGTISGMANPTTLSQVAHNGYGESVASALGAVPQTRIINTTGLLTGGGNLQQDRT